MKWKDEVASRVIGHLIAHHQSSLFGTPSDISRSACDLADALAAEACKRWGHSWKTDRYDCERCGELATDAENEERRRRGDR